MVEGGSFHSTAEPGAVYMGMVSYWLSVISYASSIQSDGRNDSALLEAVERILVVGCPLPAGPSTDPRASRSRSARPVLS